jgi:putative transposase
MKQKLPMPTIWEVPDDLWGMIEVWLQATDPPKPTGRKKAHRRRIFDGILFRLRTGCQWNHIPRAYGDDSTLHRYFQRWCAEGLFEQVWAVLVELCDELQAVHWEWQAANTMLGKARRGGDEIGPNPTDRAKNRSKRSLLVDQEGGPLGIVVAPANRNDQFLLEQTIEAIVVDRPKPTKKAPQHLCLDKGYDNPTGHQVVEEHRYTPHIRRIGEERSAPARRKKYPPRRWVVERTLAWLSKCRALLVRYDKKAENFLGLLQLACGLLWYRRLSAIAF